MRAFILSTLVLVIALPVWAGEREAQAALALALAQSQTIKSKANLASCGKCRTDEPEARADALIEQKPLVLFVGGPCDGLGQEACKAGAIPVKVSHYDHDGLAKDSRRVVVLQPKADGSGFVIDKTLPAEPKKEELKSAITEAKPVPAKASGKKLNWFN